LGCEGESRTRQDSVEEVEKALGMPLNWDFMLGRPRAMDTCFF
jgi:hypothetical protein